MNLSPLSPENVSSLIDHVMKSKDPATVGLRKILKKKDEESKDFSFHAPELIEFDAPGTTKSKRLSEDDTRTLELEKNVHDLQIKIKALEEKASITEKDAFVNGRTKGFGEGVAKGIADTTKVYEKKIDALQEKIGTFLKSVENAKKEMISNTDHLLLKLCFEIVKKMISSEVQENKEYILSVIKKAISYIGDKERLIIRVAPTDFETVSNRKDFWLPVTERLQDILIEKDERISLGGCIIESNSGMVDARLGVQFNELAVIVENVWANLNSPDQVQTADKEL
jgi:flagellar assembly protein FliH